MGIYNAGSKQARTSRVFPTYSTYIHSAPAINLGSARNVRSNTVGRADLECAFLLPRNSQFVSQKESRVRVLNDDRLLLGFKRFSPAYHPQNY